MVEIALSEKLISGPDAVKSCRHFCSRDTILVNQILHISLFYTLFRFELAFGVNMKVLDNFVSFPMALVFRENDF